MLTWIAQLTGRQLFVMAAAWITVASLVALVLITIVMKRISRTESRRPMFTSVSIEPVRAALLLLGPPTSLVALRAIARCLLAANAGILLSAGVP